MSPPILSIASIMEVNADRNLNMLDSKEILETQFPSDLSSELLIENPVDEINLPTADPSLVKDLDSLSPQLVTIGLNPILATIAAPIIDLTQTFALSSLASANQTIYLDFDGNTTIGTAWNSTVANILTPAYNTDSIAGFSTSELTAIQQIWQRVAEDFSPFNVNVTTKAPTDLNDLIKTSSTDTRWGVRVAIGGSSSDWFGQGAGGVAYLNSFNWNTDTPAFIFTSQLANGNEKYTAEAISHEVGHTLGLQHDGRISPAEGYYLGQGTGETGWAPLMGAGYYKNLTQWSKGEYAAANNPEDDLQIITTKNGFGYRADDTGNTISTATALTLTGTTLSGNGIIERNTDVDFYSFVAGAGAINLNINPAARGANLDILAELYSADGTLIASSNPLGLLAANIATTLATAGTYYLKIDGVGAGDPLVTGYTDYGSLGQYSITGDIIPSNMAVISLAVSPATVLEDGVTNMVYTFSRTGDTTTALTVNYHVAGTATFGTDYSQTGADSFTGTIGAITFAAGATTATLTIDPTADTIVESNETVSLTLVTAANYLVATPTAITGTIVNDDIPVIPVISLAVSPATVLEDGVTNLVYTFSRTGDTATALTVDYKVGGAATFGSDYTQSGASSFTTTTGKMTFAAGASTAILTIDPTADTIRESNETVTLSLVANSNYTLGTTTAITGTILDDDTPLITLAVSPASVLEDGAANLLYTFTRTGNTANTLTVKYSVGGTATLTTDYSQSGAATFKSTAGTITFAANATTAILTIDPKADKTIESDETVALTITANSAYNIGTTTAVVGTILNDEVVAASSVLDNQHQLGFESFESAAILTQDSLSVETATIPDLMQGLILDLSQMVLPTTKITFTVDREAHYNNAVGFYRTLDTDGSIQSTEGILKPTDAGYIHAALQNALANAVDSGLNLTVANHDTAKITANLDNSFYLPIFVADGTLANAANGQQFNGVYTAFASANADKTEHIRSLGNNTFGVEDAFGGGDRDYNDLIIKASIS
jgi:Domain of unknown function (DUF4114)/Metallo-peptidase family M12B Reprolysin-like/Calx-beta domain